MARSVHTGIECTCQQDEVIDCDRSDRTRDEAVDCAINRLIFTSVLSLLQSISFSLLHVTPAAIDLLIPDDHRPRVRFLPSLTGDHGRCDGG
jgi:hypothetical protein